MELKLYTVSDIRALGPCYDPVKKGYCTEDWTGTAMDVLKAEKVPVADRIWLATCWLDDRTNRLFACWCVRNTPLPDGRVAWDLLTDERSRKVVEVAERYANGEVTQAELIAAGDAAWDAAGAAAWNAAWGAAGAAAWNAAWGAAGTAAGAAAGGAAWAAAWNAAWDAAGAAAWDAAGDAAGAAAWGAAGAAAGAAAGGAAGAAAWNAAWGAAGAAAWNAAWDAQIKHLIEMIS